MRTYIALLRGVNVGGKRLNMAELKQSLVSVGLASVVTYLNSGNISFKSNISEAQLKSLIEDQIQKDFGLSVKTLVISLNKLKEVLSANPFKPLAEEHSYVLFLERGLEKEIINGSVDQKNEKIVLGEGVIYWQVKKGMTLQSDFAKSLTKSSYRDFNTNRNVQTLEKIIKAV